MHWRSIDKTKCWKVDNSLSPARDINDGDEAKEEEGQMKL